MLKRPAMIRVLIVFLLLSPAAFPCESLSAVPSQEELRLEVVLASAEEASAVFSIAEENAYQRVAPNFAAGFLVGQKDLAFYQNAIAQKMVYLAKKGDEIVGFTLVCDIRSPFASDDYQEIRQAGLESHLENLTEIRWLVQSAVSRGQLHRGVGTALLRHLEKEFPQASFGASIVEHAVSDLGELRNEANSRFRQKEGFTRIGGLSYPYKAFSEMTVGIYLRPAR